MLNRSKVTLRSLLTAAASRSRTYTTAQPKIRVLRSAVHNPCYNLATEEWIFNHLNPSTPTLFLWRNAPSVIIECNLQKMEEDGVNLVRRKSGGGAVYQDLGNFIFTFLNSRQEYSQDRNYGILKNAISNFGVTASFTGRNDMLVDGKKISGSAYKLTNERAMHHGTILVDLNKESAVKYLNVNKEKLKSKGVDSVRQRIVNLAEVNPAVNNETLSDALVSEFFKAYNATCEIEDLDEAKLKSIDELNKIAKEYEDWEWRFGASPNFEHNLETRFDWGIMDVYLSSEKGRINDVKIYSDSLYPAMVEELQKALKGATYDKNGIIEACDAAKVALTGVGCESNVDEFKYWLVSRI